MKPIAAELTAIIEKHLSALRQISENEFSLKPSPAKWSKKEILGHLIDSAQTNIRRFVTAQYEDNPHIVYNQDKWVSIINYQQWNTKNIIDLWFLLNTQIVEILNNTSAEHAVRKCRTDGLHTIEWLARDYIKHLLHHLHVVLGLAPITYP
jgi:hypothetical protein